MYKRLTPLVTRAGFGILLYSPTGSTRGKAVKSGVLITLPYRYEAIGLPYIWVLSKHYCATSGMAYAFCLTYGTFLDCLLRKPHENDSFIHKQAKKNGDFHFQYLSMVNERFLSTPRNTLLRGDAGEHFAQLRISAQPHLEAFRASSSPTVPPPRVRDLPPSTPRATLVCL